MANRRTHAVLSAQDLRPIEIWTQCIFESCDGPNYMAELLNLTMVSKKWKEALMSTRTLWARINVNEGDQDSQATIAVFLHLSGMARLTLTISVPLSSYWDDICKLLLPNNTRIHNIILASNKDSRLPRCQCMGANDSEADEPGRVFKHVIKTLDLFKTKQNLEVTSDIPLRPRMLLPASAQLSTGNWLIHSGSFNTKSLNKKGRRVLRPRQITMSIAHLADIRRYSSNLGHLEYLHFRSKSLDYIEFPAAYIDRKNFLRLPLLTTLHYHARFQPALSQLVNSSARLQHLDIQIGILDVVDAINTLEVATSLRCFTLTLLVLEYDLDPSGKKRPYYSRNITNTISKKRPPLWCLVNVESFKCEIKHFEGKSVPSNLHVDYLWRIFHAIFPNLRHLVWNLPIQSRALLASLARQSQLIHFESTAVPPPTYHQDAGIMLSTLESLSVNDVRIFHGILISNLAHLSMKWQQGVEFLAGANLMQLQSLTLIIPADVKAPVELNPKDFPLLKSILITFHGPDSSFKLPNLPTLTEIRISTRFPRFTQGMKLCASLLCEPEVCPKLEKIYLDSFVQWDVLFFLLKRRNLGPYSAIAKIRELGLSYMTPRFRPVLTSLLDAQEVPLDTTFYRVMEGLSIWEAQLRLLDEHRVGCVYCVYVGIPDCEEPVKIRECPDENGRNVPENQTSDIGEPFEMFSLVEWMTPDKLSIIYPDHDRDWTKKYTEDVLLWRLMAREWSKIHYRTFMCHKRPYAKTILLDSDNRAGNLSKERGLESQLAELEHITKECVEAPYEHNEAKALLQIIRSCLSVYESGLVHNASIYYSDLLSNPRFFEIFKDRHSITGKVAIIAFDNLLKDADFKAQLRVKSPQIVGMLMSGDDDVRKIGVAALVELSKHTELLYETKEVIFEILSYVGRKDLKVKGAALRAFSELAPDGELCQLIDQNIDQVIDILRNKKGRVQKGSVEMLRRLAGCAELHPAINKKLPRVIYMLQDENYDVRANVICALTKLAEYAEFFYSVSTMIDRLVDILQAAGDDIRLSALDALISLAEYASFRNSISSVIPTLVNILKDGKDIMQLHIVYALTKLGKHTEFRGSIGSAIPRLVNILRENGNAIRLCAIDTLTRFAEHAKLFTSISPVIPPPVNTLRDEIDDIRSRAIKTATRLAKHAEVRSSIKSSIPQLVTVLKDKRYGMRSCAINTLAMLAGHAEFLSSIKSAIPQLLDVLKDGDYGVRSSAVDMLAMLADHDELRSPISLVISQLAGMLRHRHQDIRQSAVDILTRISTRTALLNL